MLTDKSGTFHFHEDLARMSPDEQKRRVAELLEFAASIVVPPEIEEDDGSGAAIDSFQGRAPTARRKL
ncbi:MAG TPA: hypothetical protein VGI47_11835 [Candidatus Binataceae bacterium]|jgi:hypothetical protein